MKEKTVPTQTESRVPATREESRTLTPPVDIFEVSDGLAVVADLPGVAKEDIDIRVDKDVLTIRGKVKPETLGEPRLTEFELVDYFRQFELPEIVDQAKIHAETKFGVLTVHLPKAERAKPKKISVNVK